MSFHLIQFSRSDFSVKINWHSDFLRCTQRGILPLGLRAVTRIDRHAALDGDAAISSSSSRRSAMLKAVVAKLGGCQERLVHGAVGWVEAVGSRRNPSLRTPLMGFASLNPSYEL
jgi:hypothetical protein